VSEADRQALLAVLTHVALAFADTPRGWVDQMPYGDLVEAIRGAADAVTDLGYPAAVVLDRLATQAGIPELRIMAGLGIPGTSCCAAIPLSVSPFCTGTLAALAVLAPMPLWPGA
jgi:hypothetical protein